MKKRFFTLVMMSIALSTSIFTSCGSDDEPTPQIVDDPMKTATEYYISGKVTGNDGAAVAGVSVKTNNVEATTDNNGQYKLTLDKTGTYSVAFAKSGYLSAGTEATIASNAEKRSMLTVNIKLAKESVKEEVTANSTESVTITNEGKGSLAEQEKATVAVTIDPGSITTDTKVSVTPYVEPVAVSTEVKTGTTEESVPLCNIVISSEKPIILEKPVTLAVKNQSESETTHFDEIEVYNKATATRAGDSWGALGTATFNEAKNSYEYTIEKGKSLGGQYSFRVKSSKTTGPKLEGEYNKELVTKSNAGNVEAIKGYEISFNAWAGWAYTKDAKAALQEQGITDEGIASMINDAVEAQEGTTGTYKVPYTFTTNISGNYVMSYSNRALYCVKKYTFAINKKPVAIELKAYAGMKENYINTDATQHSGGTGNN